MGNESGKEFFEAIRAGDVKKVEAMLRSRPTLAHAKAKGGLSAILFALYTGRPDAARVLVDHGADLDVHDAAALGNLGRLRDLLESDPGLLEVRSADGFTSIGLAAYFGHREAAEYLLRKGANANAVGDNELRFTALTGALTQGHREVAKLLVATGADVNHRTGEGLTPLMYPAFHGDAETAAFLLDHGADVNARDNDGKTALGIAVEKGHDDVASVLRRHGGAP